MSQENPESNQLIPLNEQGNLVARVNSSLSSEIYRRLTRQEEDYYKSDVPSAAFGRPTRVSDMYMSRYGIMGYAEYSIVQEVLGGIILFPKKLSLIIQFVGEDAWKQFKGEHFGSWELEKHVEDLADPRHIGVRFVDEKYYWACHPDYGSVGDSMIDQIRDVTGTVLDFLKRLDGSFDRIRGYTPENPSSDFSRLQVRGFLTG